MNTALRKRGAFLLLCGVMVARLTLDQVVAVRVRPRQQITLLTKNKIIMEKTNVQRDMDAQEVKRIWQQIALGAVVVLIGLLVMGLGEMVCRWIEGF